MSVNDEAAQRFRRQMIAFYGTGLLTIGAGLIAKRSIAAAAFLFDSNFRPPSFNMMKDAFKAIGIASFLAVSGMGFGLSGVFWIMNVSGVKQFSKQLKTLLGGDERQKLLEQMAVSEEVAATEKTLNDLLK